MIDKAKSHNRLSVAAGKVDTVRYRTEGKNAFRAQIRKRTAIGK